MYLKAHAKINVVLNVVGKNSNNYHLLDMIVLPLELFDLIAINRISKKKDNVVRINDLESDISNNICLKISNLISQKYDIKKKYEFSIYKNIPMQSGLGGGSSDAAQIFKFYNKKFKLNISNEEAIKMLSPIGSDIPFFLINKPMRVQGIGEILTPIKVKNNYHVLIVKPQKGLSTKDVYYESDNVSLEVYDIDKAIMALESGNDDILKDCIGNSLELPASRLCPKIKEIKEYLIANNLPLTSMTGSGSAVFSLFKNFDEIKKIGEKLKSLNYEVIYTKIINEE